MSLRAYRITAVEKNPTFNFSQDDFIIDFIDRKNLDHEGMIYFDIDDLDDLIKEFKKTSFQDKEEKAYYKKVLAKMTKDIKIDGDLQYITF